MATLKRISLVVLVSFLIISCNKNDDKPQLSDIDLSGTWELTEYTEEGTSSATILGTSVESTFTGLGKNLDAQVVFNKTPNTYVSSGSFVMETTYTIEDQTTTEDVVIDNFLGTGEWEVSGNMLIINNETGETAAEAIDVSTNKIKLKHYIEQEIPVQGFIFQTKVLSYITVVRK